MKAIHLIYHPIISFIKQQAIGLFLLFSILSQFTATAQVTRFPVDANMALTPPYSVYLSDYTSATNPLFRLNLRLNDQDKFSYQVKLRLTIENIEGLTLRTKPGYVPNPIYLQPNQILPLNGADLANYFNLNNLEITGNGSNEVKRNGRLPESVYTFKVEVLDYIRNQVVSNQATTMAWIIMSQPPIPISPMEQELLQVFEMQRVRLSWAVQHQSLPNMGRIVYTINMVELQDPSVDPNNAILSIAPIFSRQTYNTWFDVDFGVTTLMPGKSYAWQIIATDEEGRSRFKNGGRSPVQSFQYGQLCAGPLSISAEPLDSRRFKVEWEANDRNTRYNIRYKENTANAEWFYTPDVYVQSTTINDLKPDTEYIYQLKSFCNIVEAEYSDNYTVRTAEESVTDFACGTTPAAWNLENVDPIGALNRGDVFYAADFDIKVTEVSGGAGQYTGEGLVVVPMMNHMKIRVAFNNVRINTDSRLVQGKVVVIGGTVQMLDDETRSQIYAIVNTIDNVLSQAGNILGTASEIFDVVSGIQTTIAELQNGGDLPPEVSAALDAATDKLEEAAEAALNGDLSGAADAVQEAADIIKNALGEVGSQPNTPDPGPDGDVTVPAFDGEPVLVEFVPAEQQQFGFDAPRENYALQTYAQKEILGNSYPMAYKAISSEQLEALAARFAGENAVGASIGYKTSYMTTTKAGEATNNLQKLNIMGIGGNGQDDELVAFMNIKGDDDEKEEVITGALKIASYSPVRKKLVIVPVNNTSGTAVSGSQIQQKLNAIYQQAVSSFTVAVKPNFSVSDWDENDNNQLDNGASGMLTNYPEEMRNILKAYKRGPGFEADTYYIFLVENAENSNRVAYMPRKKEAGFVFMDMNSHATNTDALVKTIAHELGHGAFRLEHTFEGGTVQEGATDNLMDYNDATGTFLHKYQWDLVHDPVSMITLFDDDEEGAYEGESPDFMIFTFNPKITLNDYDGVRGELLALDISLSENVETDNLLYDVTEIKLGEFDAKNSYKVQQVLRSSELYVLNLLNGFTGTKDEVDTFLDSKRSDIEDFLNSQISSLKNGDNRIEDYVQLDTDTKNKLTSLIDEFDQRGIEAKTTIVEEEDFEAIKSLFEQDPNLIERGIHVLMTKSGKYEYFYKSDFFTIPTNKTTDDGAPIQLESFSQSELKALNKAHIEKSINNPNAIGDLSKRNEKPLNIFERGMWVVKVSKDLLEDIEVPEPMWLEGAHEGEYPFSIEALLAGLGDGVIDEFKSIPELLVLGLSLFDEEERLAIWEGISSIDFEMIAKMVDAKATKYEEGGKIAYHEGGYDLVQVASIFWGGAFIKGGKKASDATGALAGIYNKIPNTLKTKMDEVLDEAGKNEFLTDLGKLSGEAFEKIADDVNLVDAWSILKNTGLNTNVKWLEKVSDFKKAGLELIEEGAEVKILRQGDEIARISEDVLQIKIPYGEGWAKQSTSDLALKTLDDIGESKKAYRLGTLNKSQAGEAQFWSPENPYDYDDIWQYADKYGIPEENLLGDNVFFEVGIIQDGVPIITREAPGFGDNLGGAIEVVVPSNGMKLESFNMVTFDK